MQILERFLALYITQIVNNIVLLYGFSACNIMLIIIRILKLCGMGAKGHFYIIAYNLFLMFPRFGDNICGPIYRYLSLYYYIDT